MTEGRRVFVSLPIDQVQFLVDDHRWVLAVPPASRTTYEAQLAAVVGELQAALESHIGEPKGRPEFIGAIEAMSEIDASHADRLSYPERSE